MRALLHHPPPPFEDIVYSSSMDGTIRAWYVGARTYPCMHVMEQGEGAVYGLSLNEEEKVRGNVCHVTVRVPRPLFWVTKAIARLTGLTILSHATSSLRSPLTPPLPSPHLPSPSRAQLLLSGGSDGFVTVWSTRSHERLVALAGHTSYVMCVLAPPGRASTAYSGS